MPYPHSETIEQADVPYKGESWAVMAALPDGNDDRPGSSGLFLARSHARHRADEQASTAT